MALAGFARPSAAQEPGQPINLTPQRVIPLSGEVVEVRPATPFSTAGMYRLVDSSNSNGILIRSSHLPSTRGPFRVQAMLSGHSPIDGIQVLDEIDRVAVGQYRRFLPLLIAGLGLVAGLFLLRRYLSAWQDARRLRLGSPTWLIPIQDNPEENATASLGDEVMRRFNYHLDYAERERAETLRRQVRRLAAWPRRNRCSHPLGSGLVWREPADGARSANFRVPWNHHVDHEAPAPTADPPSPVAHLPLVAPEKLPARGVPTGTTGEERPARQQALAQAVAPATSTTAGPRGRGTPADTSAAVKRQPVVVVTPLPTDTTAAVKQQPLVVVTPPPPAATPATPAPDPAALGRAAAVVLLRGAVQEVAAINRADVQELRDRSGSSTGWSKEMLGRVQELKPTATIGDVAPPVLTGTDAETRFPVTFLWRGNFGVNRSKTVGFAATARLEGDRWVLVAVWPLEKFP